MSAVEGGDLSWEEERAWEAVDRSSLVAIVANVSHDPSGVLVKTGFERWSGHARGTTWVVHADAPALEVKAATCPTASQLLDAAEADAGR